MGHKIVEAWTGEKGMELAESENPDLILMDIQLPGINGLDATKKIREMDFGKTVPIVAITSFAMVGDKEKFLASGFDGYIEKPIDPQLIVSQLGKFL